MNVKYAAITGLLGVLLMSGCSTSPHKLQVAPVLMLDNLKGVTIPVELVISDHRENGQLLGYRNAKKEGAIGFTESVTKSIGESIQAALIYQGVRMSKGEESATTRLEVQIHRLNYSTPDESWVSRIEMHADVLLVVSRSGASMKKRFKANRKQDVVAAPNKEFNEGFMNTLISELINKALNDKEIANFLK
jgi:uncharacterized lipoprotein YajG